jgi:hypothetical protein
MKKILYTMLFCALTLVSAQAQSAREATIEADTKARLILQSQLSSKMNEVGDTVTATLDEPLLVNGELVIPKGTEFIGRVTYVKAAKRGHKAGEMALAFEKVMMPWGVEPVTVVLTSADDWNSEDKYKASQEGKVNGGKRGEKTMDNVIRGGHLGALGAGVTVLSGGAGVAGAAAIGVGALGGLLITKGAEVRLAPGTLFRVKFAKPLTLPVVRPAEQRPGDDSFDRPVKKPGLS